MANSVLNLSYSPIPWMAPEQIREREYSEKSDVWAYGALLVEIVTAGNKPYYASSHKYPSLADLAVAIRDDAITPLIDLDDSIKELSLSKPPKWLISLLKGIFKQTPQDRPDFASIIDTLREQNPEFYVRYENEKDDLDAILTDSMENDALKVDSMDRYSSWEPDNGSTEKAGRKKSKRDSAKKSKRLSTTATLRFNQSPKYKTLSTLGEGSFGVVSLGLLEDGRYVAVKQVSSDSGDPNSMYNEAKIMLSLKQDRNVIKILGLTFESGKLAIVMEFAAFGTLEHYVERMIKSRTSSRRVIIDAAEVQKHILIFWFPFVAGGSVPSQQLFRFAYGIARGMRSLASQGVVHRDLAARNILLDSNLEPKVSDFGLSRNVTPSDDSVGRTQSNVGPIKWMDSSAFKQQYSEKSDVWSFGCVIYEMLTGEAPYGDMDLVDIIVQVRDKGLNPLKYAKNASESEDPAPAAIASAPEYFMELLEKCFHSDISKRPNFATIVQYLEENAPAKVLRVEAKRAKRRQKREEILRAVDEIVV